MGSVIGDLIEPNFAAYARVMAPEEGSLGRELSSRLVQVIRQSHPSDQLARFEVWEGYAGLRVPKSAARIVVAPNREMFTFEAPLTFATTSIVEPPFERTPTRWEAVDGAWRVSADLYSRSVVIGGTEDLIAAVTARSDIEAYRLDPAADFPIEDL